MNVLFPTVLIALALRWVIRRDLDVLLLASWRRSWLIVLAVVVQFTPAVTPDWARWPATAVALALAFAWLVANNALHNPWLGVFLFGLALNTLVMALNHGMPVSSDALVRAGFPYHNVGKGHFYRHVELTDATRLRFLADLFAIRAIRSVISVGDVFMLFGLGGFLVTERPRRSTRTLEELAA